MGTEKTQLDFTVTPSEVEFSVYPDRLSVVRLTIGATNRTGADVRCTRLDFSMRNVKAFTDDLPTIASSPGSRTPWAIAGGGGSWTAVPVPPFTAVADGATISFALSGIVMSGSSEAAELVISETTNAVRQATVSVRKSGPAPAGTVPTAALVSDAAVVGAGCLATLTWRADAADKCILTPGPIEIPDPTVGKGSVPVTVYETTTYRLHALGKGGKAVAEVTVGVAPVALDRFEATPKGPVAPGSAVELSWTGEYTAACSIDQGVGPVRRDSGSKTIAAPTQTTVYTLTALGLGESRLTTKVEVIGT